MHVKQMIRIADQIDWQRFYELAGNEGWRVPPVERRLFAGPWQQFARVMAINDYFCGLVTAVTHQRSAWIGNLIVPRSVRGCGYGTQLFQAALAVLQTHRADSVWLTASKSGRPIYEKFGFREVDTIERWVSPHRAVQGPAEATGNAAEAVLRAADHAAWGETRAELLDTLIAGGQAFAVDDTAALLQQEDGLQMIGPWYAPSCCPRANRLLLQQILAAADPRHEIIVDLLASSPIRQLLAAAGFSPVGSNALMVRGDAGQVDLRAMVSLASLGSIG